MREYFIIKKENMIFPIIGLAIDHSRMVSLERDGTFKAYDYELSRDYFGVHVKSGTTFFCETEVPSYYR